MRKNIYCIITWCSALCVSQVTRSTTLQPVEVRVCCVRAARDKLPRGLYTVSVALHGRLGGPALAWCSKKEQQQRAPSAEPVAHRGRFWDTDLHFNQSLLMVRTLWTKAKLGKWWWCCNKSEYTSKMVAIHFSWCGKKLKPHLYTADVWFQTFRIKVRVSVFLFNKQRTETSCDLGLCILFNKNPLIHLMRGGSLFEYYFFQQNIGINI